MATTFDLTSALAAVAADAEEAGVLSIQECWDITGIPTTAERARGMRAHFDCTYPQAEALAARWGSAFVDARRTQRAKAD